MTICTTKVERNLQLLSNSTPSKFQSRKFFSIILLVKPKRTSHCDGFWVLSYEL